MSNAIANNVDTTTLSAQTVYVEGKELKSLIHEESTGTKVNVETFGSGTLKIATLSVDGEPKDICAQAVSVNAEYKDGLKLATISVDNQATDIFIVPEGFQPAYSAFEVYPNTVTLSAGTVDPVTGIEWKVDVPPATLQVVNCRIFCTDEEKAAWDNKNCDVWVDWGDGKVTRFSDCALPIKEPETEISEDDNFKIEGWEDRSGKPVLDNPKKWLLSIHFKHDYASSVKTENDRFVFKVYGKQYYEIRCGGSLVSRAFESDLPIARNVGKMSSTITNCARVQKIEIKSKYSLESIVGNCTSVVSNMPNLVKMTGCGNLILRTTQAVEGPLACPNLEFTDWKIIPSSSKNTALEACPNLRIDYDTMIPDGGFGDTPVVVGTLYALPNGVSLPSEWKNIKAHVLDKFGKVRKNITFPSSKLATLSHESRATLPAVLGGFADYIVSGHCKCGNVAATRPCVWDSAYVYDLSNTTADSYITIYGGANVTFADSTATGVKFASVSGVQQTIPIADVVEFMRKLPRFFRLELKFAKGSAVAFASGGSNLNAWWHLAMWEEAKADPARSGYPWAVPANVKIALIDKSYVQVDA